MAKLTILKEINSVHGSKIHGHTFQIEFHFEGELENNMVGNLDFHVIEPQIDEIISKIDKIYLDDVIKPRATIENIAIYLLKNLVNLQKLYSIKVWEGKEKNVEIFKEEIK